MQLDGLCFLVAYQLNSLFINIMIFFLVVNTPRTPWWEGSTGGDFRANIQPPLPFRFRLRVIYKKEQTDRQTDRQRPSSALRLRPVTAGHYVQHQDAYE